MFLTGCGETSNLTSGGLLDIRAVPSALGRYPQRVRQVEKVYRAHKTGVSGSVGLWSGELAVQLPMHVCLVLLDRYYRTSDMRKSGKADA